MRILRLEPDDVIIAPFAVIAVAVAFQGETLLSLFVFVLWRTFPDWTHLPRRFRDWEFSLSNFLLNSQLQRVDLGSTFDNLETCFSGLVWSASSLDRTSQKKPGYGPWVRFSKVPVTFWARNQIFKSKYKE